MDNMNINFNINNMMEGTVPDSTHSFQYGAICDNINTYEVSPRLLEIGKVGISPMKTVYLQLETYKNET